MNSQRTTILGLFVLAVLAVLAYFTLFLTDFALFAERPTLRVRFAETNGLREGDSVLVAGMRWGRVKSLVFDPQAPTDARITVTASLNEPLPLRTGFSISIRDATLLGGRNLWIDPGPPSGGSDEPDHHLNGGGLSCCVGAQDGKKFPAGNLQVDPIHCSKGSEVFGQAFQFNHGENLIIQCPTMASLTNWRRSGSWILSNSPARLTKAMTSSCPGNRALRR